MTKADGQVDGLFCKAAHCQTLAEHISVVLESRYGYPQVVEYLIVGASGGPYGIRPPLLRFLYWGWRSNFAQGLFISPRQAIHPLTETTEPVESRATRLNLFWTCWNCVDEIRQLFRQFLRLIAGHIHRTRIPAIHANPDHVRLIAVCHTPDVVGRFAVQR